MNFERLFKSLSYAAVFCGFLSMWVSGTFGTVGTGVFIALMVAAWFLEGSRWQISERLGTVLIIAALPLYYVAWRAGIFQFADSGTMVAGILGRLILSLSAIKILQRKSDRDWIFLYLMAFFEVLLAAGLSISALYLFSFVLYVFVMVCTVIVFEVRKTGRTTRDKMAAVDKVISEIEPPTPLPAKRLPVTAVVLIFFIIALAVPMFFLLPRVGGAGLGGNPGGVSTSSGFSDTVRLGGIGSIQQNDEIVMRVRLEGENANTSNLKWRGVSLDTFDNKSWSRKVAAKEPHVRGDRDLIQLDYATGREGLTTQTVYLEPLENPVLFALPRIVAVQGNFPVLFKDRHGSVSFNRSGERVSYKVLSDRSLPQPQNLRADQAPYPENFDNYLKLPEGLDPRIKQLAVRITGQSQNRYDTAKNIESYLQNKIGYTLEQKASGDQPLADFLFNVKEGHCEYFATAMAIMLRTEGIATRIVNGFSQGEYNDTADVWVVRQRNAHSWVEVYFPGENTWVPFDPTPFSGQVAAGTTSPGIGATVSKYLEALETFWIQYFVAFDNQEQRSLFTSVKRGFSDYQSKTSGWMNGVTNTLSEWWADVRGDNGIETSLNAVGRGALYVVAALTGFFMFVWLFRRIVRLKVWRRLYDRFFGRTDASIVKFYERMIEMLAEKGFVRESHQTPLEFAYTVGMPEAVMVTEKYNQVRFGVKNLRPDESSQVEEWLDRIESEEK
ncbi:MAG: DUF3488 domain-containing protein [Acidobacteria bacterium]|nr:DUF3488 domain-containing protein [Acidobacteriota bacterium]